MLSIKNISKIYKTLKGNVVALKDLSLEIDEGEVICLLGPNGAGKTTTIKLIGTFVNPTTGTISYNNISIKDRSTYLKNISVLFEGNRSVIWSLKVEENLEYFCGIRGLRLKDVKERIIKYMKIFGLEEYKGKFVNELSRGNQQKLAVASVLVLGTPVVLLDEPTLGLDFETSDNLMNIIKKEVDDNKKIFIITSHDADFIDKIASRIVIIDKGEVKGIFKVEELKSITKEENFKNAYLKYIKNKYERKN
jgi:ABC-2 type transport system ATP-binding protein